MPQSLVQRSGWFLGLILSPILFSSGAWAKPRPVFPLPTVDFLSEPASTALETALKVSPAGLQFEDSRELNQGKLMALTGTTTTPVLREAGRCVGRLHIPPTYDTLTSPYTKTGSARARFLSKTVSPAPGLRVMIRNTTAGMDQRVSPYTDREYSQGDRSEGFTVKQDIAHDARYLAVMPGRNTFTYQIKRRDQVIESGSFTAMMVVETRAEQPTHSGLNAEAAIANPLGMESNPCEPPDIPDIKVPDLQLPPIPDVPVLPPDIQQLLDSPKQ
jgi:hypothetical protein